MLTKRDLQTYTEPGPLADFLLQLGDSMGLPPMPKCPGCGNPTGECSGLCYNCQFQCCKAVGVSMQNLFTDEHNPNGSLKFHEIDPRYAEMCGYVIEALRPPNLPYEKVAWSKAKRLVKQIKSEARSE